MLRRSRKQKATESVGNIGAVRDAHPGGLLFEATAICENVDVRFIVVRRVELRGRLHSRAVVEVREQLHSHECTFFIENRES